MASTGRLTDAAEVVGEYLEARIGLRASGSRRTLLHRDLREAMRRAGARSAAQYCARLDEDGDEFDRLMAQVTVGESYFFREAHQLELLRRDILPERASSRGNDARLHLWSAGCASGQEAYTLAIVLEEQGLDRRSRIIATDLSSEALSTAAAGVYGSWSLRSVTERQRDAYFQRTPLGYRIDERFARRITFRRLNLLDPRDQPPAGIDVAMCRNVLIYFSPDAVERAALRLSASLAPGGWLITGSSDPPLHGMTGLTPVVTSAGVVYRRSAADTESTYAAPHRPLRRQHHVAPEQRRPLSRAQANPTPPPPPPVPAPTQRADSAVARIRFLSGRGELATALVAAAEAVASFPLDVELRYLEAVVALEAGQPSRAAESARAALYLDHGLVVAHLALARAEIALGRRDAAERSLRNAQAGLRDLAPDAVVPLSDGERAGRLAAMIAAQRQALGPGERHRGQSR